MIQTTVQQVNSSHRHPRLPTLCACPHALSDRVFSTVNAHHVDQLVEPVLSTSLLPATQQPAPHVWVTHTYLEANVYLHVQLEQQSTMEFVKLVHLDVLNALSAQL